MYNQRERWEQDNQTKRVSNHHPHHKRRGKKAIELLDGCYVITTSLTNTTKDTKEEIHKAYKTLIKVENAFKSLKTEFLEIRPLYLRTDDRIKGHIFLSMLSYNILLKLKGYIREVGFDLKSTITRVGKIQTIINKVNSLTFETIPSVDSQIKKLFTLMDFNLPSRI